MDVAVVGAGALGTLFAALLDQAEGVRVTLVSRRAEVVDRVRSHGVTVHDDSVDGGTTSASRPAVVLAEEAGAVAASFDTVLLLHKAGADDWAVGLGCELARADGVVVSLQNGLGTAARLQAADERGVAGVTYQAATAAGPGEVVWTARGPTLVAPRPTTPAAGATAARFSAAVAHVLPVTIVPDAEVMLWEKLVGAVANFVSGASLLPIHQVMTAPAAWDVMERGRAEVLDVAEAAGVAIDRARMETMFVAAVAAPVRRAAGSTYQSLVSGRPDEVTGMVTELRSWAHAVGVAIPVLQTLASLVEARQQITGAGAPSVEAASTVTQTGG